VIRTRREVLQAFAALGAVSCTGRSGGRTIAGSIVGGAHTRGHKIREGLRLSPDRWEQTGVAIVGGGIAGLSAAWGLERAAHGDFIVLELEDAPGGTARFGNGPITPYPWGAHYVPAPGADNQALVRLLEEVGAVSGRDPQGRPLFAEHVLCRDPQERVFFRGEWFEGLYPRIGATDHDLRQLDDFTEDMRRWSQWRDASGRRAFTLPRAAGSDAPEIRALDQRSMAEYMDACGWTSPRLRWLVEYACRDDFGATLAQTSAWAGIHYHAARLDEDGPAELLTWPEGNGRLVRHLAEVAGARLRLGALVAEVRPGPRGGVEVVYATREGEAVGLRARAAVFALPGFLTPYLVAPRQGTRLAPPVYGSWMVANLTLRERPRSRGFPLAWDNVLYDSPSLGYVVATHQSGRDHGATVFTYYRPMLEDDVRHARTQLLATPWEEWVEIILDDLGRAHPNLRDVVERIDVYLWGHAMVRPRPGSMWSADRAQAAAPVGAIHFAHTDLSGMALFEEAQYWGLRAGAAAARNLG
jgi:glycine/D-amino acid oxidase-like deaminating enzyme